MQKDILLVNHTNHYGKEKQINLITNQL